MLRLISAFQLIIRKPLRILICRNEDKEAGLTRREAELQCSSNKGLKQSYGSPMLSPKDQALYTPTLASHWAQTAPGRDQDLGEGD